MRKHISLRYLVFFPILSIFALLCLYSVALPLNDYWSCLGELYSLRDAPLSVRLHSYWSPFVDHRHFLPIMTINLLFSLTNNRHYFLELLFGFATRLVMLSLFWCLIRKTDLSELHKTLALLVSAFLIFWPLLGSAYLLHWHSTTYGWSLTSGILAVYLLHKFWGRWLGVGCAALACMVSGYSHSAGMSLWLTIGLTLLLQRGWSGAQKAVWWLASGAAFFVFSLGMPSRAFNGFPPYSEVLKVPMKCVTFFFQTFAPPFTVLLLEPRFQTLAGLIIALVCVLPILVLLKQKRLSERTVFPWLAVVVWCLGMAGSSALARCTFSGPNPLYIISMILAPLAAAPLWLLACPNLWPAQPKAWLSVTGFLRVGVSVFLIGVYAYGYKEGWDWSREHYRGMQRRYSLLQYYPADIDTVAMLGAVEGLLPYLAEMNAFPDCLDATPFTIPVPTTFAVESSQDVEVAAAPGDYFQLVITGAEPSLVLKPSPEIYKRHAVSFTMESSAAADLSFNWYDGMNPPEEPIEINRKGELKTENWGYFPESRPDRRRPVTEIRLSLTNVAAPQTVVTIRDLQVWTR